MNTEECRKHGGKLAPLTKPCLLLGINAHGPAWLLLVSRNNREVLSSDVVFLQKLPFFSRGSHQDVKEAFEWFTFKKTTHPNMLQVLLLPSPLKAHSQVMAPCKSKIPFVMLIQEAIK